MRKLMAAALMLAATGTFAGDNTINILGRAGWKWTDKDSKTEANSSSFDIDYLRTSFVGAINPSVKYLVTTDLIETAASPDDVDNTSAFIDEAFVTKSFASGTGVTIGKKTVFIGGRDFDYSDSDRYTTSYFYDSTPENQVGVTLTQEWAGQTFVAQYFNGNKKNGGSANQQSKFGYSVGWYGDLFGGWVKPIVSYTVVPEATAADTTLIGSGVAPETRAAKGNDQYIGAGVQLNTPHNVVLEGDYTLLTEKKAVTGNKDLKTRSIVGLIRYSADRFSPFVKVFSDERKNDSTKTNKRFAYDAGIEFKEKSEDPIRYHVVYSGSTVKDYSTGAEVKTSPKAILVGLKFDASVLK